MDIYEYLKMDHEKVAHLFSLFEKSKRMDRKQEIVSMIIRELMVHAHSEQETFYKVLEQNPENREEIEHKKKEHDEIDQQIELIASASGKKWEEAVLKLKALVEHHVKEEEGEVFKRAKKTLSDELALIIKEKMHYLKGNFMLLLEKKTYEASKKETQ